MRKIKNPAYWLITFLLVLLFVFANDIVLALPLKETYQLKEIELNKYDEFAKDFDLKSNLFIQNKTYLLRLKLAGMP